MDHRSSLERDIVIRIALGIVKTADGRFRALGNRLAGTPAVFAGPTEHLHLVGNNFSDITLVAVPVVVGAGLDLAFDKNLLAFVQILAADFSQLAPGDNVVPFGLLLLDRKSVV